MSLTVPSHCPIPALHPRHSVPCSYCCMLYCNILLLVGNVADLTAAIRDHGPSLGIEKLIRYDGPTHGAYGKVMSMLFPPTNNVVQGERKICVFKKKKRGVGWGGGGVFNLPTYLYDVCSCSPQEEEFAQGECQYQRCKL